MNSLQSKLKMTRRVTFASGHRYWLNSRSEDENRALFGPWASRFNHGHNYRLDVTVEGVVDFANGMIVNIKWVDDILKATVLRQFDQRSINDEIPHFANASPSIENLLIYLRNQLDGDAGALKALPEIRLTALRLEEHALLWGELELETNTMTLTRVYEFAASHRLDVPALSHEENLRLFGKCNNPAGHGHNYVLEVTVTGEPNPVTGMMVDLGALDEAVNNLVVNRYDHRNLNVDLPEFAGRNTTSEVVALQIFSSLNGNLPAQLFRVRLHETARNIFEVTAS